MSISKQQVLGEKTHKVQFVFNISKLLGEANTDILNNNYTT
jgi:hypothetical protein